MTHPNEYPGKVYVPYDSTMLVGTTTSSTDFSANREGIQGVGPFLPENGSLSEENLLDHSREEFMDLLSPARARAIRVGQTLITPLGNDQYRIQPVEQDLGTEK